MSKISIRNALISSSGNFGLSHGTTRIQNITSTGVQITGSLFTSGTGAGSDLFKIGNNYIYASSSGQIGVGTSNPTALLEISGSNNRDFLIIRSGSLKGMTINSEGVLVLGGFTNSNIPSASDGGIYYNSQEKEFFFAKPE
tara:strand:- start:102 stop:524 length:423 start_codon:yes stop_codon:yes gene_type:complete